MKNYIKSWVLKFISIILFLFHIFPVKRQQIYVINFTNLGMTDNPKYIIKQLLKDNKECKVFWKTNDKSIENDQISAVKPHSLEDFYRLSTSRIIISNVRLPLYYKKRKQQFYIETWHGSIPLKKIGYDGNTRTYLSDQKVQHFANSCDILTSNSEFSNHLYKSAFGYQGIIVKTGTPRVDAIFDEKYRQALYKKIKRFNNEIVVTYAPTFRDYESNSFAYLDYKSVIEALKRRYKRDVILIFRLHPTKAMNLGDTSCGIVIKDDLMDLYETLSITDILISDYSSLMFEFMVLNRPIIQYVPDLNEYSKARGLYFNLDELPFSKAKNTEELIRIILNEEYNISEMKKFSDEIGLFEDGNASKRVAEIITEHMEA